MALLNFKDIRLASTVRKDEIDTHGADTAFDPDRRVMLDRRVNNDRRGDYDPDYRGPVRRNTIDRRMNTRDRRK